MPAWLTVHSLHEVKSRLSAIIILVIGDRLPGAPGGVEGSAGDVLLRHRRGHGHRRVHHVQLFQRARLIAPKYPKIVTTTPGPACHTRGAVSPERKDPAPMIHFSPKATVAPGPAVRDPPEGRQPTLHPSCPPRHDQRAPTTHPSAGSACVGHDAANAGLQAVISRLLCSACSIPERRLIRVDARNQAQTASLSHGSPAVIHAQLAVNALRVLLDRNRRQHEPLGDFLVREPFGQQDQDVDLAIGQRLRRRLFRGAGAAASAWSGGTVGAAGPHREPPALSRHSAGLRLQPAACAAGGSSPVRSLPTVAARPRRRPLDGLL